MRIHSFLIAMCLGILHLSAQVKVECWGRHELSVPVKVKGNPFDVEFSATFKGPDTTLTVRGFYDGNDTFKIRFMPTKIGEWKYETSSNIQSLTGKVGSIQCISATNNNGLVQVKDKHNFEYANGTPYYAIGTTAYAWIHMNEGIRRQTLASLEVARFNKIRMCVFPKYYSLCNVEPEIYPFEIREETVSGKKFDYSRFNPAFFRHLESCVEELAALGIEADLILFHPYDKGQWGFDSMPEEVNLAYIRYITARLSSFNNVWWSLANEYDYVAAKTEEDWMKLIKEVRKSDPYSHLCSIHGSTAMYFPYEMPELTHVSAQDEAPVEEAGRAPIIRNIYRKPVVMDEVAYEGNLPYRWGRLSGAEMLHRMWQGMLAGIYVTHGECYQYQAIGDTIFWAQGGKWRGESWKRIPFTRSIVEGFPNPLQMADVSRDAITATAGEGHYYIYFGEQMMEEWTFNLPNKNANYGNLKPGTKFKVDIIDTWGMTITPVAQTFEVGMVVDYRLYDVKRGKVRLPLLPYMMLRIMKINE